MSERGVNAEVMVEMSDLSHRKEKPRITNVCPECGQVHKETFPVECKNCGRPLGKNQEALMRSVAAEHISARQVQEKTGMKLKKAGGGEEDE